MLPNLGVGWQEAVNIALEQLASFHMRRVLKFEGYGEMFPGSSVRGQKS